MAVIPPKEWEPKFDEQSVRAAIWKYTTNPEQFDEDGVRDLESHASYFRVPFARSKEHQENFITSSIEQIGKGWAEGFTTLVPEKFGFKDEPKTTGEAIARNIGHLAGFVGYLPGGKLFPILRALRGKSAPMFVAGKAQKAVSKRFKPMIEEVGPVAKKFAEGTILSDLAGGAFHLGVASATSSWMHGIDEMMHSAAWGGVFGAGFRGIGNLPGFGKKLQASQLDRTTGSPVLSKLESGQKADLGIRTLAGSLFMGLPSSLQGATTEEQVYSYLLGSFFGFKEIPYQTRTSRELIHKSIKDDTGPYPENHPDYKNLNSEMRKMVERDFEEFFGPHEARALTYKMVKGEGLDLSDIEELAKLHDVNVQVDPVTGEIFEGVSKRDIKAEKERLVKEGAFEDMEDLDMHIAKLDNLRSKGGQITGFVERELKEVVPENERINASLDIFEKWSNMQKKGNDGLYRPSLDAEEKIKSFIEKKHRITFTDKQVGWWRSLAEQQRKKEYVKQITSVDGESDFLSGTKNAVGNQKEVYFEPPLVQKLIEREFISLGMEPPRGHFYTFLDHYIFNGREYDIIKAEQQLANEHYKRLSNSKDYEGFSPFEIRTEAKLKAEKQVNQARQNAIEFARSKGYYYFGGKGDSKRLYFTRYHPRMSQHTDKLTITKNAIRDVFHKRWMRTKDNKNIQNKGMHKNDFDKAYREGLSRYKKNFDNSKNAERNYLKSFVSNSLYDVTFNGFPMEGASFKDFIGSFKGQFSKVLNDGFISDSKAFNKRAQIWFNTGLSANRYFISKKVKDAAFGINYHVFRDNDKNRELYLNKKASEQIESTDGGIIGRSDFIDALNLDKGLPIDGGVNKSFIVSPNSKDGALLGKYMIHSASPELEAYMRANNIHFIAPQTAIKQMGQRIPGSIKEKNGVFSFEGETYTLPAESFRTIMSEVTTASKFLGNQKMVKQMFTNLSMYAHSDIDGAIIKDMYKTLSDRAMSGSERGNDIVRKYEANPTSELERELLNNIEDISVVKLMEMMRNPKHSGLSTKIFQRITKMNNDMMESLAEEGEISRDVLKEERIAAQEFNTITERLLKLYPEGTAGGYLHKFVRDYRMVVLRNYVVSSLTRPGVKNSGVGRLRPLDPGFLAKDSNGKNKYRMSKIEDDDNIFFLDDGFKELLIHDPIIIKRRNKLGEIFEDLENGKYDANKKEVEEILRGVLVRVPMDSLSGANVLQFAGFTGVRGLGIMAHPRTIRALGGADYDGDKAYIFFGGAEGLKPEWKDMYSRQRDEFIHSKGAPREMHNKDEILPDRDYSARDAMTVKSKDVTNNAYSQFSYYDPYWRYFMSKAASSGRDILGVAVTSKQAILGAYNAVRGHDGKPHFFETPLTDNRGNIIIDDKGAPVIRKGWIGDGKMSMPFVFYDKNGKAHNRRIVFKTKNDPTSLKRFRMMARTAVGLGSDPMDEAGLHSPQHIRRLLFDELFEVEIRKQRGKTTVADTWWTDAIKERPDKHFHLLNKGLHTTFGRFNSLVYGKNYQENRRWSYADIKGGTESMSILPEGSRNTLMPMLAENMRQMNWSDNLFRRVDFPKLIEIYEEHKKLAEKEEWLKDVLQRNTLGSPMGALIKAIHKRGLWNEEGLRALANDKEAFEKFKNESYGKDRDGKKLYTTGKIPYQFSRDGFITADSRKAYLEYLVLKAEDYIVNDLSDMVTLKRISDIARQTNMLPSRIGELHKMAEDIKQESYLIAQQRKEREGSVESEMWGGKEKSQDTMEDYKSAVERTSVKADQSVIDQKIARSKELMTQSEKELFDTFLIGTFQRGNMTKIQQLSSTRRLGKKLDDVLSLLEKQANGTSLVRVGLSSKSVDDSSIKKFFDTYDKMFKKGFEKPTEQEVKVESEKFVGKDKVTDLKDGNGKRVEGQIIEESDLNSADRKYLDEVEPFRGLHDGKLKDPEMREVYYDVKRHLDNMHNSNAKELNFLFRTVTGKNMNIATKLDWIAFRNYLNEMNTPGWWRRMWDFMVGKSDEEIKRTYYWKFPTGVDKELLRSPAFRQMTETVGPYRDRLGNTIMGKRVEPMTPMARIRDLSANAVQQSLSRADEEKTALRDKLSPFVASIEEGDVLHDIAIAMRERPLKGRILKNENKDNPISFFQAMQYEKNWKEVKPAYDKVKNKTYRVVVDGKVHLMTGNEVIKELNKIYTAQNEFVHKWLVGDSEKLTQWLSKSEDKNGNVTWKGLDNLRDSWMSYLTKLVREGKNIPIEEIGIDGIRQISKRVLLSMTPNKLRTHNALIKGREKLKIEPFDLTGQYAFENYFPHLSFDRGVVRKNLEKALDMVMESPDLTKEEKLLHARRLFTHYRQMTGDYLAQDEMSKNFDTMQEVLNNMASNKQERAKTILHGDLKKVGNQFSRTAHLGGWNRNPEAYEAYMKNIIDSFYKQTMQVANRVTIYEFGKQFYKQTKDAELTNNWSNYFKLYAQQAMGYPTHIPKEVMNNPGMKISMTPYKWFSDSQTKKRVDSIRKKLGIDRKTLEKYNLEDSVVDELTGIEYSQLSAWSALEAKYQLASLLAHPKSSIANLYGGTVHTMINTGIKNWRNARNFEYLKNHVNPEWNSIKDVEKWLQKLGVQEEFLIYEAGLNPKIKSKRVQNFVREVGKKLGRNEEVSDKTLLELKKQYKLTDSMWNFAASFMRRPERTLRRDSFMAHYLQAREAFGNSIKDFDHPFLIEMAKRGVKATQFLYSAPYRPMFANSSLGRVFSRFQLWSWNSVRFRKDTIRQAKVYGLQPGTTEFDRFKRMAQADALMLSLSNLFLYSLFENALPAPYNWLQDLADWAFGDDRERERAFYGSPFGPLQAITPPSLRLLAPSFKWLMDGDSSRLTDYYLWTMLPFGRMIRDVIGPGNVIENPYYAITKVTGIPIIQIGEAIKKEPAYNPKGF